MEEPRIDKTVYTGRPENTEGRLEKEIAVYEHYTGVLKSDGTDL